MNCKKSLFEKEKRCFGASFIIYSFNLSFIDLWILAFVEMKCITSIFLTNIKRSREPNTTKKHTVNRNFYQFFVGLKEWIKVHLHHPVCMDFLKCIEVWKQLSWLIYVNGNQGYHFQNGKNVKSACAGGK